MAPVQPSDYLWQNLCALLGVSTATSIDKVHKAVSSPDRPVSRGSIQRIKERDGHRSTDVLADIAAKLGVEVWQLLIPDATRARIDAAAQAVAAGGPAPAEAQWLAIYRAMTPDERARALAVIASAFPDALLRSSPSGGGPEPAPQQDQAPPSAARRGALQP
jgi:hypothetical protein